MTDVEPKYPTGFASFVELGVNVEPMVKLVYLGEDEAVGVMLTMEECAAMMSIVGETMMRAAMVRKMTTIFPDQRDAILENLRFRWSGGEGLDDGSTDQGS